MPKKSKGKEELEEIEEEEIEEIIEEMEKEVVEEKEKKKEEKREPVKERKYKKKKREKREPIVRDDLSETENFIVNLIAVEPRRPRAITRMLKGKLNQNEVVSLLRQLEEKKVVKREGTKSWIAA
ncbi:MAG: hypothetical protein ACUVXA_10415 [Candidatus Jordarchaeum sp.]|uniref:hypothetical protein n=1 Tax=Candidatus Jordarchaeum sp. TaxID=2823881 RepID=UPI00404980E5